MKNGSEPNFFDKRTLIAVGLMMVFFVGWNMWLAKKYPQTQQPASASAPAATEVVDAAKQTASQTFDMPDAAQTTPSKVKAVIEAPKTNEEFLTIDFKTWQVEISNYGMGLRNVLVRTHTNRDGQPIQIGRSEDKLLYSMKLNGFSSVPVFSLNKISDTEVVGTAVVDNMTITRTYTFNPDTYSIKSNIIVKQPTQAFNGLTVYIPEEKAAEPETSMFSPSLDHQLFVVRTAGKTERIAVSSSKEPVNTELKTVSMAGIGSQYFAGAIVDKSSVIPSFSLAFNPKDKTVVGELKYTPTNIAELFETTSVGYFGPKSLTTLKVVDPEFSELVDLGFFAAIGRPLLTLMKFFYGFVGNWGIAIILLTILVRALVLPFNIMSYKSMKAMQKVNPLIQSLRDKYKDDPTRLNQEMMSLFKEHKVNPMGGCLPMLLQIPVFFALYQVLGQSVELYQAPFIGWIHDLSLKDPYFVIPILMGIAMFIQQKITPTTMDPTQAKIMLAMPVVFAAMMLGLPSGLTLYILVSTLFGIFQQMVFLRDKTIKS
jgi:YidC/Oxa1 family membrane protein insertase